ncbi:MAG: hypothetical protein HY821_23485 [Acidobacteria bacterium]|nr:hypothetical protein [Acidobacteriota bacterium]
MNKNWMMLAMAAVVLAGCSAQKPASEASGVPSEVSSLIGAKGSSGEAGLQKAGYEFRNAEQAGGSSVTHWQGKAGCLEVTTTDGRYASITVVDAAKCKEAGKEVAASGAPGAMKTVCGVIVKGQTTRYLCEVEENRQGTTVLRMPDTTLKLKWQVGSRSLELTQDDMKPVVVKYSDAEGETNFKVDERTFFYIANPAMAAMEVKDFKP